MCVCVCVCLKKAHGGTNLPPDEALGGSNAELSSMEMNGLISAYWPVLVETQLTFDPDVAQLTETAVKCL